MEMGAREGFAEQWLRPRLEKRCGEVTVREVDSGIVCTDALALSATLMPFAGAEGSGRDDEQLDDKMRASS